MKLNFHQLVWHWNIHRFIWLIDWFQMRIVIYVFCGIQMQFQLAGANFFRSRIDDLVKRGELTSEMKQETSIIHVDSLFKSECNVPCQLQSFWISFDKILAMSEIPSFLHTFLKSKSGDMIDVGKCSGRCGSSIQQFYSDPVRVEHIPLWCLSSQI